MLWMQSIFFELDMDLLICCCINTELIYDTFYRLQCIKHNTATLRSILCADEDIEILIILEASEDDLQQILFHGPLFRYRHLQFKSIFPKIQFSSTVLYANTHKYPMKETGRENSFLIFQLKSPSYFMIRIYV